MTILQRRLASSPEAILRSLQRRRDRLTKRISELEQGIDSNGFTVSASVNGFADAALSNDLASLEENLSSGELEELESTVVDAATAAQTAEELQAEIKRLNELVAQAQLVRNSGTDTKWQELRDLLQSSAIQGVSARTAPRSSAPALPGWAASGPDPGDQGQAEAVQIVDVDERVDRAHQGGELLGTALARLTVQQRVRNRAAASPPCPSRAPRMRSMVSRSAATRS